MFFFIHFYSKIAFFLFQQNINCVIFWWIMTSYDVKRPKITNFHHWLKSQNTLHQLILIFLNLECFLVLIICLSIIPNQPPFLRKLFRVWNSSKLILVKEKFINDKYFTVSCHGILWRHMTSYEMWVHVAFEKMPLKIFIFYVIEL